MTVIVMLILAGVSLNAIVGDNGIITNAQNATFMQSCAMLEEYLQQEFVKYYDDSVYYANKAELLGEKITDLYFKVGGNKYVITSAGGGIKKYYLINKEALPQEIKTELKGGNSNEYAQYAYFIDVYGVTEDLKVYYCENGSEGNVYGNLDGSEISSNTPVKKINSNASVKDAIRNRLGIEEDRDLTVGDVQGIKEITFTNISDFTGISELYSLRSLTIKDSSYVDNLEGIESCLLLEKIIIHNSIVDDYSKLNLCSALKEFYMYIPSSIEKEIANNQVEKMSLGFQNSRASLKNLAISGETYLIYNPDYEITFPGLSSYRIENTRSNVTNISPLHNLSNSIKSSLNNIFLHNNSIDDDASNTYKNVKVLEDFSNLTKICLMNNAYITNLDGLENHKNLEKFYGHNCYHTEKDDLNNDIYLGLNDITGLSGEDSLVQIDIYNNLALTNLNYLNTNKSLLILNAFSCNITDITGLANLTALQQLSLYSNVDLVNIISLKGLININHLYLANNINMDTEQFVQALDETGIMEQCGINRSYPPEYEYLLTSILPDYRLSVTNVGLLTDTSEIIETFKAKSLTNINMLDFTGQSELSNDTLNTILKKMVNLKCLCLNGCENLSTLDFICSDGPVGLYEIDLRNTNSSLTDLSNIDFYCPELAALILNNYDTDFSKIQNLINQMYEGTSHPRRGYEWSFYNGGSNGYGCKGLILCGDNSQYTFSNCYNITDLFIGANAFRSYQTGILDLSNLTNLTNVWIRGGGASVKLPSNVKYYANAMKAMVVKNDLSACTNLEYMIADLWAGNVYNEEINTISIFPKRFDIVRSGPENLTFFHRYIEESNTYTDCSRVETLQLGETGAYYSAATNLKTLDGIEYLTNLKELIIDCRDRITDLSQLNEISNLENFELHTPLYTKTITNIDLSTNSKMKSIVIRNNNQINTINGFANFTMLESLVLDDTGIWNLSGLSNNTGLSTVSIKNSAIADLSEFDSLIQKCGGHVNFTTLDLTNNSLGYYSASGNDNVQTILNLLNAGVEQINVTGNTIAESNKLKGNPRIVTDEEWYIYEGEED